MNKLEFEIIEPKIIVNFKEFKSELDIYTEKYDISVTSENTQEAKASCAALNKIKLEIKSEAKKYIDILEAPIKEFKFKLKEIDAMLDDKRQIIVNSISVFEDAKRLEHDQAMIEYIDSKLSTINIRNEFTNFVLPNASVVGLTSNGSLSKKFKDRLDLIIENAIEKQRLHDIEAENKRLKDEARANEIIREREREREREKILEDANKNELEVVETVNDDVKNIVEDETISEVKNTVTEKSKSHYEITLVYKIASESGINTNTVLNKVLPRIKNNEVPIASTYCKEIIL